MPDELLTLAAALEGHPDNVAAALYGGSPCRCAGEDGTADVLRRFRVPEAWIPVALHRVGDESRTQRDARRAAGDRPARGGRAAGGRRAALLATAVMTSDAGLLRTAMDDGCTSRTGCRCCRASPS